MRKKYRSRRRTGEGVKKLKEFWGPYGAYVLGVLFFLLTCLSAAGTVKAAALVTALFAMAAGVVKRRNLAGQLMRTPLLALTAYVLMGGISMFYAMSGKFALHEFLKLLIGWSVAMVIAAFAAGEWPGERAATALEGACALAGVVSIDLLSTRLVSGAVLWVLNLLMEDYRDLTAVEEGVRMNSLYMNPNVFAGCMGLGVLLSLGLAVSEEDGRRRGFHVVCLYVNSLSFVLAFSMGATGVIVVSFLAYLALEKGEKRPGALVLMAETLVLAAAGAGLVSATSLTAWTGFRMAPLACAAVGSGALWALDRYIGRRIAGVLHGRGVPVVVGSLAAALAVYAFAAVNVTGGVELAAGEGLRRAAYPEAGAYTLEAVCSGDLEVRIESQNQQEAMMHTSTVLYDGAADGGLFEVPEDSLVVYFNLRTGAGAAVERLEYAGEKGSGSVPLGYKLLPGFMANRLQGLFANENAIQRTVFFADGMKLFRRSPVFGVGLGSFETALKSVQSFYYETKYVHNHYIQTLLETGMVGLILFVVLLGTCAAAVWRSRKRVALAPALGAAVVFMAGHAMVEVVFSYYAYLPLAFGVVGIISVSCGESVSLPAKWKGAGAGILAGSLGLTAAFVVLLVGNMSAQNMLLSAVTLEDLTRGAELDKFEWADYMLSYVSSITGQEVDESIRAQGDEYARRLAKLDSNTIPVYLAEYYFSTGRPAEGLEMTEKYVRYLSSDPAAWQLAFRVLEVYAEDTEVFREGVGRLAELLEAWNEENMGTIELDEGSRAFLQRMGAL